MSFVRMKPPAGVTYALGADDKSYYVDEKGYANVDSGSVTKLTADGWVRSDYVAPPDGPAFEPVMASKNLTGGIEKATAGGVDLVSGLRSIVGSECYLTVKDVAGVPMKTGDGHALTYTGGANPVRSGDYLTTNTGAGQRAIYAEAQLDRNVTRMGCEFMFSGGAGGVGGAIGLIPWKTSMVFPAIPATGVHFVVTKDGFGIDYFDALITNKVNYAAEQFRFRLSDDTLYRVEWFIDGDTLTVFLPDGQVRSFQNAAITSKVGPFACWEIYQYDGAVDAFGKISRMWASSKDQIFQTPSKSKQDSDSPASSVSAVQIVSIGATPVPTSSASVDSTNLKLPLTKGKTGKALVKLAGYVDAVPSGASLIWGLSIKDATSGATASTPSYFVASGVYSGRVQLEVIIDVTWGNRVVAEWTQFCTASGASMRVAANSPWVMSCTPI